ncbi:helix-turn-helix domain-containing protein [Delftia sp. PS-11]|uniref:helix-turn-helix domain-containing protein n=1 Tax=Delftia sp. PS-11 TaxID=2767222 RepID=UPI0024590E3B|nr:helix-turn-helix domain-containing protein [Delftia sp. PS-11]KAJ8745061.1 helix-turn-helix domain-containing protein [Delftia sp. PS-11]
MSEVAVHDEAGMQDDKAQSMVTAGMMLRQAREAAGLSLEGLAAALKVPAPKLQALEADDHASFQDQVFMRALAQSVCRALRMDSAPVMALLPRTAPKSLADERNSINATFKERSFKGSGMQLGRDNGSRKVVVIVLLLLAAAAAVYFLPVRDGGSPADPEKPRPSQTVTPVQPAAPDASPAPAPQESSPAPGAMAPAEPAAAAPAATAPAAAVSTAAASAAAAPAAAVSTAAPPASADVLVLKAGAQSWVQVRDASGRVVLQKTLAAGESTSAEGVLPLSVVVGNASATEVRVRGEVLDVTKTARDNVARFEVK